ncbi:HlyD family efflux transporter periplasmic adaptor subunit [Flavobacterium sp. MAH-1]|uniref:HlyD family efflux transporter periplasmic adaptor subunit n=1 Tax=Flavobacterium agri TaxID=2743471 RepID=A0A7Y8Y4C8_9FLAO|nr:HlyD family efflux transporter periplasmic adaptor subunit [Flavobacterium agri]NUY82133.1 HlyD family efflux transporter periplasmic adaptor subunit [Flavobacterium agri]NYA72157.1 HlyD family efflux transporter periplasmic adaptor subunit [Flavobacterium agri]
MYYNTRAINFIKILNRLLVGFVLIAIVLVLVLSINDTVSFKEGQIFSDTPQMKINAPNEVRVVQVLVKEGQKVKKGDTLFVLENKKTKSDFDVLNADVAAMTNKIKIIEQLIANTEARKQSLVQLLGIQSRIYKTDRKKTAQEIALLNNKINVSTQQHSILSDKFKTDSLLYAKGAISRYEMTETKNRNLDDKKGQLDIKSTHTVKNYDFENLSNNYSRTKNDLKRSIIDVDNQIQNYRRDIIELQNLIKNGQSNLTYISDELNKMIITAPVDGTISNLYNSRQDLQIVNKGELLTIVAPSHEKFYAKVTLDEQDLAYVKEGQEINLKLDAYNYYRYGAIKGNITYVSPSDVDRTFYCLAHIQKYNPNINLKAGYRLKGEVIIERMRLFRYITKKLFNKIDNAVN